jgi:glycerol kinase
MESITYQTADLLDAMHGDSGVDLTELRVDGGAVKNDRLMQFQADVLQMPVVRSKVNETTALGAAYLAGLAVGFWKTRDELKRHWKADRVFWPLMSADVAKGFRERWNEAVRRAIDWAV